MKTIFNFFTAIILICGLQTIAYTQLTVDGSATPQELAESILGDGVTISNVNMDCPGSSAGSFANGGTTVVGVDNGMLLTSGSINNAPGPNDAPGTTTNNGGPGDADLDAYVGGSTLDACYIEFDFVPEGNFISFNYVFASEEYEEFFCSSFNDVFGFFVSGPNPGGGDYNNENIALVPSTTLAVAINNVGPFDCNGVDNSVYYNNNDGDLTIEYDGYVDLLTAAIDLVPCQTYHIKLAIADRGDRVLDSGVFIEAGSFVSTAIIIEPTITDVTCPGGSDGAIDIELSGGEGSTSFDYDWSNGETTQDISGLAAGTFTVTVESNIGCIVVESFEVADGVDNTPPTVLCSPATVHLDSDGNASVTPDDFIDEAFDNCTEVYSEINVSDYYCITGEYDIVVTVYDYNGNSSTCKTILLVTADDKDCDTYADACDSCDGGDDTIDNNGDGLPDCAYPPAYDDIIDEWKCGNNNKVYMCHIPEDNPANLHTICINYNAVPDHMGHGDYLGPCGAIGCDKALSQEINASDKLQSENNSNELRIYPNPSHGSFNIEVVAKEEGAQLTFVNSLGESVYTVDLSLGHNELTIDQNMMQTSEGIHYIYVFDGNNVTRKKLMIIK